MFDDGAEDEGDDGTNHADAAHVDEISMKGVKATVQNPARGPPTQPRPDSLLSEGERHHSRRLGPP